MYIIRNFSLLVHESINNESAVLKSIIFLEGSWDAFAYEIVDFEI